MILADLDIDAAAVAFARFVKGVGENFEKRVAAAVKTVLTENNGRTQTYPVRAF